ncbi:unnamed protein product [Microthlaspi erraticum]|uniref:Uncharacterized protein n=1 Tax=Microthlaspi erraticum TaxID=1685480 RepID=A0A6D2HJK9_9BRAS|nr:unnamed protein product [Microthlaspi erraticum]
MSRVYTSRHVVFLEYVYLFSSTNPIRSVYLSEINFSDEAPADSVVFSPICLSQQPPLQILPDSLIHIVLEETQVPPLTEVQSNSQAQETAQITTPNFPAQETTQITTTNHKTQQPNSVNHDSVPSSSTPRFSPTEIKPPHNTIVVRPAPPHGVQASDDTHVSQH